MANKRMFNIFVVDSDAFLDMPLSAQALYFHLNMRADDDGFIGNPKRIQRLIGASEDDLKLLVLKRFVLVFEDGVIVIKHWKMHNTIQRDRYHPTVYKDELKLLGIKENKSYTFPNGNTLETNWKQNVSPDLDLDLDLDKDIDKDIVEDNDDSELEKAKRIVNHLNESVGTKYKYNSKNTLKHINARLSENFTEEDFYTVIDYKVAQWKDDAKMKDYLRPDTLFGTKFESYLNSAPKRKVETDQKVEHEEEVINLWDGDEDDC